MHYRVCQWLEVLWILLSTLTSDKDWQHLKRIHI